MVNLETLEESLENDNLAAAAGDLLLLLPSHLVTVAANLKIASQVD